MYSKWYPHPCTSYLPPFSSRKLVFNNNLVGGSSLQKFVCVEGRGFLGFICRAAPAGTNGAYLGYDTSEILICEAQYQQKWEDMVIVKRSAGGFEWCMRKDDHLAFVGIHALQIKIFKNFTKPWGLTEVR